VANVSDSMCILPTAVWHLLRAGQRSTFSRLASLTDAKQDLHANVSRFPCATTEKYAVLPW